MTEAAGVADREAPSEGNEADKKLNSAQQAAAPRRLGKDPTAQTDFLPDHEREAQEIAVREQLKKEYELRQKVRNAGQKIPIFLRYYLHCVTHVIPSKFIRCQALISIAEATLW